jgi:hypothetical protein
LRAFEKLPYAVFGVLVVAEIAAILILNDGMLVYSLDDAYIHLSLANRIWAGTYGINAGEASAPASSILWPFLLAAFSSLPASAYILVPCLLNIVASSATLTLLVGELRGALSDGRPFGRAATLFATGLIFCVNLVPIIFTGMEHSLQQLLAVVLVRGLIQEARVARVPRSAWFAVALLPMLRYDSLALAVPALLYFVWRGHMRGSFLAMVAIGAVVGTFSSFLLAHGLDILPASVLAKSDIARASGGPLALLKNLYGNLSDDHQANTLLFGGMLAFAAACDRGRAAAERGLGWVIVAAVTIELVFGRFGAYYRYEAYICGATVMALIYLYRGVLSRVFAPAAPLAPQVVAIGGLVVASLGYLIALANTPAATNNIYDQQYQMHRFAVDYYRRPVAVNDLGWVAFRNTNYILDLGGLASREALLARASESNPDWMRRLAAEHGVHLAMIYDEWFVQKPPGWVRVGQLKFNQLRVTAADSKVSFYATDADSVAGIRAALLQFQTTLPKRASCQFDTPRASGSQRAAHSQLPGDAPEQIFNVPSPESASGFATRSH